MDRHDIEQTAYSVLVKQFAVNRERLTPEWSLRDHLGADSMALVELVVGLEEAFGRDLLDVPQEEITTVGDLITFIQTQLQADM